MSVKPTKVPRILGLAVAMVLLIASCSLMSDDRSGAPPSTTTSPHDAFVGADGAALTLDVSGRAVLVLGRCWQHVESVLVARYPIAGESDSPAGVIWQADLISKHADPLRRIVLMADLPGFRISKQVDVPRLTGTLSVLFSVNASGSVQTSQVQNEVNRLKVGKLLDSHGDFVQQRQLDAASCGLRNAS